MKNSTLEEYLEAVLRFTVPGKSSIWQRFIETTKHIILNQCEETSEALLSEDYQGQVEIFLTKQIKEVSPKFHEAFTIELYQNDKNKFGSILDHLRIKLNTTTFNYFIQESSIDILTAYFSNFLKIEAALYCIERAVLKFKKSEPVIWNFGSRLMCLIESIKFSLFVILAIFWSDTIFRLGK